MLATNFCIFKVPLLNYPLLPFFLPFSKLVLPSSLQFSFFTCCKLLKTWSSPLTHSLVGWRPSLLGLKISQEAITAFTWDLPSQALPGPPRPSQAFHPLGQRCGVPIFVEAGGILELVHGLRCKMTTSGQVGSGRKSSWQAEWAGVTKLMGLSSFETSKYIH